MNVCLLCWVCLILLQSSHGFLTEPSRHNDTNVALLDTNCGKIQGFWRAQDKAYVFRGIPYAEPPVGRLRWKAPVPMTQKSGNCWDGTYKAKSFGNKCFQPANSNDSNTMSFIGDEDCLYLNVWTPTLNASASLPVMFWIHGGSLVTGSGHDQDISYAPTTKLAAETGIVYVSINYRLNAFGFMALDWLQQMSAHNTSGNYGFMDMIVGLQWVQENIRSFGGDPDQVTIFGQSSGGTAIFALLGSPLSKELFHKAWLFSPSPVLNKTASDAYEDNKVFVKNTNCSNVKCLYSLSAHDVTSAVPWDVFPFWSMDDALDLPIKGRFDGALAIVDGYVLKEPPFDAWANGRGIDVPVLIGTTAQEIDILPVEMNVTNWTWAQYENYVRKFLTPFGNIITETALKLYPTGSHTPEYQYTSMTSDARVTCGVTYLSLIAATSFTSPVYRYVATYQPSEPVHMYGLDSSTRYSAHGIDMYGFMNAMDTLIQSPKPDDLAWERNIRNEVLSFVKNGKPQSDQWQPFPEVTATLSYNTSVVGSYHMSECEFWLANGFFSYSWIN